MRVRDVMNPHPTSIRNDATMAQAAVLLGDSQVSDLVVVDAEQNLAGVLAEGDLLRAVFPKFDEIVEAGGSVADAFEMFLENGRDLADQPIGRLIIRDPITASPDDELLTVATVMVSKQIRRVPVTDDGKVVGSVARADICRGALAVTASAG